MNVRTLALGLVATLAWGCLGPTAGSIALPGLDHEVTAPLAFPAGKELSFPVHADGYDYSGGAYVLLDVTLLRGGVEVARMTCPGFELEGGAGCGSGATHLNGDCSLRVPPGGSDSIRVLATLGDQPVSASFEGLEVYVRD